MQNYCEFSIARNEFKKEHKYITEGGFVIPHIGFIEKGRVTLYFQDLVLCAEKGDVIFIPAGMAYHSEWTGDPVIDMYVLECDIDFWNKYTVGAQKINLPNLSKFFYELYKNTIANEKYIATSIFYKIISEVTRKLDFVCSDKTKATQAAINYIENNVTENFTVKKLASLCNLSESRFFAVFKNENGCSPIDYKNFLKIKISVQCLKRENMTVEQICERLNFSSPAFFRRLLKKFTGKTPKQIKNESLI